MSEALFFSPRWHNGPRICIAANLPAFDKPKDMQKFLEKNCPSVQILKKWKCKICQCWHCWGAGPDPAGGSSGTTRTAKGKERILEQLEKSPLAKTM